MPSAEPGSGRRCLRQWLARCIVQHQAFAQYGDGAGQKTLQGNRWEIHGLESGILLFGRYQLSEHFLYLQYFIVNKYKHLKDQPNVLRKTNKTPSPISLSYHKLSLSISWQFSLILLKFSNPRPQKITLLWMIPQKFSPFFKFLCLPLNLVYSTIFTRPDHYRLLDSSLFSKNFVININGLKHFYDCFMHFAFVYPCWGIQL